MSYETVGEFIKRLQEFPADWRVHVVTPAGGGLAIEHREAESGTPFIGIYGDNGGRVGQNPLTEEEYQHASSRFMQYWNDPNYRYTTDSGSHAMYRDHGHPQDFCYQDRFDRRVVERMVAEGRIPAEKVDIDKVRRFG